MPFPTLTVGSITVIPLADGEVNWPASEVWPNISREQWEPAREYLNPDGTHHFNLGSYLIRAESMAEVTKAMPATRGCRRPGLDDGTQRQGVH